MTDRVNPSPGRTGDPLQTAFAIRHASAGADWIAEPTVTYAATHAGLVGAPLDAFNAVYSPTSLSVTIDTGEAFVGGAWLGRDTPTSVTLPASATTSIYLGWSSMAPDTVIIGPAGDFTSRDPKTEIWRFTTDANGVTTAANLRTIGPSINRANTYYDSNNDGKVDNAAHADTAGTATSATSATTATNAGNATNFDGRSINTVAKAATTLSFPVAQVEPGERYQIPYYNGGGSLKVIRVQIQLNTHTSPSALVFRIRNSSGTVVYSMTGKSATGSLSSPLYTGGTGDYLLGIENTTSSTTYRAGGHVQFFHE